MFTVGFLLTIKANNDFIGFDFQSQICKHSCRIIQTCDNTLTCGLVTPNLGMQSTEQRRVHKKVHKNTKGADSQ